MVEGAKSVVQLLASSYAVRLVVGTPTFWATHGAQCRLHDFPIFQADEATLAAVGTFASNRAALAVAQLPADAACVPAEGAWGLVLDDIRDPGNLGTIVRLADWYGISTLVCSPTTVDLYNPKVLHASMGSFVRVCVHYVPLPELLRTTPWPVLGTFVEGQSLHHTSLPYPGWLVIGNESRGIGAPLLPYIQQRVSIPRYGQAASLNAAMATAIVCDHWRRQHPA